MPAFEELSQHTSYPVLHTQRSDGTIIVATRVPLTDVRLQQWGWILSQAYTVEQPSQGGFEGLIDSAGKRYSKIHSLSDMQHYIEEWGCKVWEVGYFAIGKATSNRVTMHLEDKIVQEDTFRHSIEDLKKFQEKQIYVLLNAVNQQEKSFQGAFGNLNNQVIGALNKMHQEMLSVYTDQQEHLDNLVQSASDILSKAQSDNNMLNSLRARIEQLSEALKNVEDDVLSKIQESAFNDDIKQLLHLYSGIFGKIEDQQLLYEQALKDNFGELDRKRIERLDASKSVIEVVQEDIKELKDILIPVDIDNNNEMEEDTSKLTPNVKTLSDRYITSLITTNTRYHNTVDKQVKDSFKLTRIILYVGVGLFVLTIISLLVTFFFHSNEITLITSGVGAMLSAIATGIGGLNKIHDNAAERQLKTLDTLSRSVRAAHAQFVIEQVNDETWKRTQLEQLSKYIISE